VSALVIAVLISTAIATFAAERKLRWLEVVFKPLTTILIAAIVGWPETAFGKCVAVGIWLSLIGDVALLWASKTPFLIGLGAFLLAHLAYVIAFLGVASFSWPVVLVAVAVGIATRSTVRAIWDGSKEVRGPALAYAAVISVMVVCAAATIGGPLPLAPFAAVGAALFYLSDSSLARNIFAKPIPHAALLTLGVYWLGQLGIAIAARG
jgi:uncharacterized membrane protein YhhN